MLQFYVGQPALGRAYCDYAAISAMGSMQQSNVAIDFMPAELSTVSSKSDLGSAV